MEEEDFFHTLVMICEEEDNVSSTKNVFYRRACEHIENVLKKQKREQNELYNPYKNLYLDKCYGDSKRPLVEWLRIDNGEDW